MEDAGTTGGVAAGAGGEAGAAGAAGAPGADGGKMGTTASASDSGGSGGNGQQGECGDGIVDTNEACEPGEAVSSSCVQLGFERGELACASDCTFDTSDCSGTEDCFDVHDNDGDGAVDCFDEDCNEACAHSCESAPRLEDGGSVSSSTEGRASDQRASCAGPDASSEVAFELTPETTGKLDLTLSAPGSSALSVRSVCKEVDSELGCVTVNGRGHLGVEATAGESLFVVVQADPASAGKFTLQAVSRPANQCGDGFVDELEQCDDGATSAGDGCSPTCQVEATEQEPNDTREQASPLESPGFASIDPAGDIDYYLFSLEGGPRDVSIDVIGVGSGFCTDLLMDPMVELLDTEGAVVASDDDGGEGYCPSLDVRDLPNGDYFIRVQRSTAALDVVRSTFGYELVVAFP